MNAEYQGEMHKISTMTNSKQHKNHVTGNRVTNPSIKEQLTVANREAKKAVDKKQT